MILFLRILWQSKNSFDLSYDNGCYMMEDGKVKMFDKFGNILVINIESYIHNEIMDYAKRHI